MALQIHKPSCQNKMFQKISPQQNRIKKFVKWAAQMFSLLGYERYLKKLRLFGCKSSLCRGGLTLAGFSLLIVAVPCLSVEPSSDGTNTLHSITTLGGAGTLQPRRHLQYAVTSTTYDVDRPPLLAESNGVVGDEDTSEFSSIISPCTKTNLPNFNGSEPPCRTIMLGDVLPSTTPDRTIDNPIGTGLHVQAHVFIGGLYWVQFTPDDFVTADNEFCFPIKSSANSVGGAKIVMICF